MNTADAMVEAAVFLDRGGRNDGRLPVSGIGCFNTRRRGRWPSGQEKEETFMPSRNFTSNWAKLPVPAAALFMAAVIALTFVSGGAIAEATCMPVNGHIDSQLVLPPACTSPVGLCTSGTLIGGIQGQFNFTATSLTVPAHPTIPSVALFTGLTGIQTKEGNLLGTNAGAIDTNPAGDGHFADLITFTGGTGNLLGASGHIVAFGTFSLATGIGNSDYRGEVCTP